MATLTEIDKTLSDWESLLNTASKNLLDLSQVWAYEAIFSNSAFVVPTGDTATKVEPVREDFRDMWPHFELIRLKVAEAKALRTKSWSTQSTADAVDKLLNGDSINLPPTTKPLNERSLLSEATSEHKISPKALLASVVKSFDSVSKLTTEIQKIWDNTQPQLKRFEDECKVLAQLAKDLRHAEPPELALFQSRHDECYAQLTADPFGSGKVNFAELEKLMNAARTRLHTIKDQRDRLAQHLTAARVQMNEMVKLTSDCSESEDRALRYVHDAKRFTRSDDKIERLTKELATIDELAKTDTASASPRFTDWKNAADRFVSLEKAAFDGYESQIAEFKELETRFTMYKLTAKGQNFQGAIMLDHPELVRIAAEITENMTKPAKLDRARDAVNAYIRQVRMMQAMGATASDGNKQS